MEKSEDLDIDVIIRLLDEQHKAKSCISQSAITPNGTNPKEPQSTSNKLSLWEVNLNSIKTIPNGDSVNSNPNTHPLNNRLLSLKSSFKKDLLIPQKIVNPKKDQVYKRQVFHKHKSPVFNKEFASSNKESEQEDKEFLNATEKTLKNDLEAIQLPSYKDKRNTTTKRNVCKSESALFLGNGQNKKKTEQSFVLDRYSGIRIVNPLVSCAMLEQVMKNKVFIKMCVIQNYIKNGNIQGNFVTMGVIVSKVPPKTCKNGNPFSMWKMSDLHDPEKPIICFLFTAAHTEHGKTTVGTVIAILGPSIVPNTKKSGEFSIVVDHPGKIMLLGQSKDLGLCKSKRRGGSSCNMIVNTYQSEHCTYHLKKEFKKFTSERSSGCNGRGPNLRNRLLKGANVFYGGKSFTVPAKNAQIAKPSIGSRNLLQPLMKVTPNKEGGAVTVISPKDLLKMSDTSGKGMLQKHKSDSTILENLAPQLGKLPVQERSSACSPSVSNRSTQNLAKMRAIQKIKDLGQLKRKDPNSTKPSLKSCNKVKAVLEKSLERKKEWVKVKTSVVKSKLGNIDLESERVKALLKRRSSHAYEVEMTEMQKEASYFSSLEKKEEMEEKMASIKEIVCDVVSCLQCKYTANTSAERCQKEQHPLKSHKALKRFFECKDCKRRTVAFSKYPKMACKRCHGSKFVHTSMMKLQHIAVEENVPTF